MKRLGAATAAALLFAAIAWAQFTPPSANGTGAQTPSSVTTPFVDAGTEYLHGALTMDGLVSGCQITPTVDSNFLYVQGCNVRVGTALRSDGQVTIGGVSNSLKITDDTTYSTIVDGTAAPSISAACTGKAVTWSAGSTSLRFGVGTSCSGIKTAVITFANTVANCYSCSCWNTGTPTLSVRQSACSTTTATITNYAGTVSTPTDWVDSTSVQCLCRGG